MEQYQRYIFKNKLYIFLVSIIDFVGGFVFFPFRLFWQKTPDNIKNILLIRMDHIGDVIYSTPVINNLKAHYSQAKITFLVANWAKDIIISNPYTDEVICYDAPWFDRKRKRTFELKRFFRLVSQLHNHRYDLGFDLRGDFRHILLMALAGVKFRVGYGITGGGFLLHRNVRYRQGIHSREHNLDLLHDIGIRVVADKPELYSSERDNSFIRDLVSRYGISDNDFIAVIHPYAGYPSKNWLKERFAELAQVLHNRYKAKIVLIGSADDRNYINDIIKLSNTISFNIAGETTLGNLFLLLKRANIFIGVDSGPSHIATCVDIPAVILYSGTNSPQEWGPVSENTVIIQKEISCSGCEKVHCNDNICMDLISIEDVLEAVERVGGNELQLTGKK